MSLREQIEELKNRIKELESQIGKERDYRVLEDINRNYHTLLSDSEGKQILCLDTIDELEDSDDILAGIRLYNTNIYEWVGVVDTNAQYRFKLKRK